MWTTTFLRTFWRSWATICNQRIGISNIFRPTTRNWWSLWYNLFPCEVLDASTIKVLQLRSYFKHGVRELHIFFYRFLVHVLSNFIQLYLFCTDEQCSVNSFLLSVSRSFLFQVSCISSPRLNIVTIARFAFSNN